MTKINVTVQSEDRREEFRDVELPLELGRQPEADSPMLSLLKSDSGHRINIAPLQLVGVGRYGFRVEALRRKYRVVNGLKS